RSKIFGVILTAAVMRDDLVDGAMAVFLIPMHQLVPKRHTLLGRFHDGDWIAAADNLGGNEARKLAHPCCVAVDGAGIVVADGCWPNSLFVRRGEVAPDEASILRH